MKRNTASLLLLMTVFIAGTIGPHGAVFAVRIHGVGYNMARDPLPAPPHPYKGRIKDTRLISPPGIREARLECDEQGPVNRVLTCEIHTFDVCGNPDGEPGNVTQWDVLVESVAEQRSSQHVAPVVWVDRGIARFYFTPMSVGVHIVRVTQKSTALLGLRTPTAMSFPVTVHDSNVFCTSANINAATMPVQQMSWAQATRSNNRQPVYGLEEATSSRTKLFEDAPHLFGAGVPTLQQTGFRGRVPVQPFVPYDLSTSRRTDNNAFRLCDYVQSTAGAPYPR